jgi:hypothetical protein
MLKPTYLRFPGTEVEVEIVLAVSLRVGLRRPRRRWPCLRKCGKGTRQYANHAQQDKNPNTPSRLHRFLQIHDLPAYSF